MALWSDYLNDSFEIIPNHSESFKDNPPNNPTFGRF